MKSSMSTHGLEDVVVWLIDNNPVVKGTATEALWAHLKEAWTIEVLEDVIEGRWNEE